MGQQQLLLLVLGIVIVGLAVVVGIQAFGENQKKSQIDNFTSAGVGVAGEIIAWYQKPTAQGGGGGVAANLGSLTLQRLGYTQTGVDVWGPYSRTGLTTNGTQRWLAVQGSTTTHPFLHITPEPLGTGSVRVEVHAFGPYPECIVARNSVYQVTSTWSDGKGELVSPDNPNPTKCVW